MHICKDFYKTYRAVTLQPGFCVHLMIILLLWVITDIYQYNIFQPFWHCEMSTVFASLLHPKMHHHHLEGLQRNWSTDLSPANSTTVMQF